MSDFIIEYIDDPGPKDLEDIRMLLWKYAELRNFDAALGDYKAEIAGLPGEFAEPQGSLILLKLDYVPAGCVAYRTLDPGICEMKRLFLLPGWRGFAFGSDLIQRIIARAQANGFHTMRLDTHPWMTHARALYEKAGFVERSAYNQNPTPGIRFFEKKIS